MTGGMTFFGAVVCAAAGAIPPVCKITSKAAAMRVTRNRLILILDVARKIVDRAAAGQEVSGSTIIDRVRSPYPPWLAAPF